jgi:hypothetical protein
VRFEEFDELLPEVLDAGIESQLHGAPGADGVRDEQLALRIAFSSCESYNL